MEISARKRKKNTHIANEKKKKQREKYSLPVWTHKYSSGVQKNVTSPYLKHFFKHPITLEGISLN
jgi:hypothetical protein